MEPHSMQVLVWITLFGLLHFLPGASLNAIDTPPNTSAATSTEDFRTKAAGRTTQRTPSLGVHHADADDDATTSAGTQSMENFVSLETAGGAKPSPTQITSTNAPRTLHGAHNEPPTTKQTSTAKTFARQVGIAETSNSAAMTTNSFKDDESAAVDNDNSEHHGDGEGADGDDNNNVAGSKDIKDLFNAIVDGGEAEQQIMLATMDATQKPPPAATTIATLRTTMTIPPMNGSADIVKKKEEDAGTFGTLRYTSDAKKADEAHTKSVVGKVRYSNKRADIHSLNAPADNFGPDKRLPELVMESIAIDAAKTKEDLGIDEKSTNGTTPGMFTVGLERETRPSPIQNVNFEATTEEAAEVTVNLQGTTRGLRDKLEDGQTPVTALKRDEVEFIREAATAIDNTQFYKDEPERVSHPPIIPEKVSVLQIPSTSVYLTEPPSFEDQPTTSRNVAGMLAMPSDRTTTAVDLSTAKSLKTTLTDWATTSKGISSGSLEPRTNGEASLTAASPSFGAATTGASVQSSPTTFKPSPPMAAVATTATAQTIHPESVEIFETIGQPEKLVATLMPAAAAVGTSEPEENNGSGGSTNLRSLNDKDKTANLNAYAGETREAATTQRPDAEEQEEYVAIAVDVGGTYEYPARLVQQPKIVYSNSNRIGNLHHQQQLEQEGRSYDINTDAAGPAEHMTWQQGREYVKQLHAAIAAAASAGDSDRTTMRHDLLSLPVPAAGTSRLHPPAADNNNNLLITTKASTPATVRDAAAAERRPTSKEAISETSAPPSTQPPPAEASTMALPTLPKTTKRRIVVRTTTAKPPPTIDDYQTITSQAGTHAFLPCNVKQLVKKPISWLRMRDGHILTVDQTTFIADERFQSIFSSNPERWSLQIKYVQAKDAGTYECQVSTEPKASAIVNLRIVEPRTELIGESTRHVKAGSQVKLHCIISQALEPPVFITWFYNQKQIYLRNRKGWRSEIESIDLPPAPPQTTTAAPTTTIAPPATITATARMDKATTQTGSLKRFSSAAGAPSSDPTTPASVRVPGSAGASAATASTLLASEPDGTTRALKDSTPPPPHARSASSPLTVSPSSLSHELTNDVDLLDPDDLSSASASAPASPFGDTHRGGGVSSIAAAAAMAAAAASAAAAANVVDVKQITTATLIIPSVEKQDSGNYTCSPSNSAPRTVVLHVLNGEYSASAITSGAAGLHMQRPLISHRRGFHQRLLRWPSVYSILVLCGFLNILLSYGCTDTVWKLSSPQRGREGLHVISSNYAQEAAGAIMKPKNCELISQQRERILCGTAGEEYT